MTTPCPARQAVRVTGRRPQPTEAITEARRQDAIPISEQVRQDTGLREDIGPVIPEQPDPPATKVPITTATTSARHSRPATVHSTATIPTVRAATPPAVHPADSRAEAAPEDIPVADVQEEAVAAIAAVDPGPTVLSYQADTPPPHTHIILKT